MVLCPCAYSRSGHRCGDEFRIETVDGTTFQGKLRLNNGDSLVLQYWGPSQLHTIALSDVKSAFRVKRSSGTGLFLGLIAGTGIGIAVATAVEKGCKSDEFLGCLGDIDRQIAQGVAITLSCGIIGAVIGAILGRTIQRLGEVQLEALPMCISPSDDTIPFKVSFAINF
jgi:hypothetical protein